MIKSTKNNNYNLILIEYLISIFFCHFMAIIFGAPLLNQFLNTFMFSILIATLSILPILILIPHDNAFLLIEHLLIDRNFNNDLEYKCATASIFSIIGAWMGALVIPLDWDRWWQQWPIPNCIGALIAFFIGLIISRKFKYTQKYSV